MSKAEFAREMRETLKTDTSEEDAELYELLPESKKLKQVVNEVIETVNDLMAENKGLRDEVSELKAIISDYRSLNI